MQANIHPNYFKEIKIVCACGHTTTTGSTLEGPIRVDICSNCHPFWTGEKKLVDTEGRVEQFERQAAHAKEHKETEGKKKTRSKKDDKPEKKQILTLKEMLAENRQ